MQVLRDAHLPVLIVPEDTPLGKAIETILLTSDLKEMSTFPIRNLYEFLDALPGKLQVVNVQPKEREKYSVETEKAIADLHKLLDKYDPGFNYINGSDVVEEVLGFAHKQHASLIIAVHHKYGFLSSLFHKSVTKKLAYNSNVPLLALPAL
jgi:nucleotide-binding universal stress UspA family protein